MPHLRHGDGLPTRSAQQWTKSKQQVGSLAVARDDGAVGSTRPISVSSGASEPRPSRFCSNKDLDAVNLVAGPAASITRSSTARRTSGRRRAAEKAGACRSIFIPSWSRPQPVIWPHLQRRALRVCVGTRSIMQNWCCSLFTSGDGLDGQD
jgi:hypothetical protein